MSPSNSFLYLCSQCLNVVFEGGVHPLQGLHCVLVPAQLLRKLLVFVQDAVEDLLGVVVELVKFVGGGEDLRSGVDELQQVGPGLVQAVLPLRDGGSVAVSGVDQFIRLPVDGVHALLADVPSVSGKFSETLLQHLKKDKSQDEEQRRTQEGAVCFR